MSIKAFFVPFERSLLEYMSDEILKEERNNSLSHILVVFPGKRPYYYLTSILARKAGRVLFSPHILSMDEFMERLLEWGGISFSRLSELNAVFLIYRIFQEVKVNLHLPDDYNRAFERFEDFLPWGFEILKLLEEMDEELVDEERISRVKKYLLTGKSLKELNPAESIAYACGELLFRFHEEMEKRKAFTRGYIYRKVADLPSGEILKNLGIERVFFGGLFLLTTSERETLRNLGKELEVRVFFHVSEWKKWEEFREILNLLKVNEENIKEVPPVSTPPLEEKVSFHSASSLHFELVHLNRILSGIDDFSDTAIVLPSPDSLIPVLSDAVSRLNTDFNVSMGYPLKRSALFSLFQTVLELQETKDGENYYLNSYLNLIKHPYVRDISLGKTRFGEVLRNIEERLRDLRLIFFSIKEIEENLHEYLKKDVMKRLEEDGVDKEMVMKRLSRFHEVFVRNFENVNTPGELSRGFRSLLNFLTKESSFPSYWLSAEIMQAMMEFLDSFSTSFFSEERFDIEGLKMIFERCAGEVKIPLPGVPLKGLQVIGMLETRCLNFKKMAIIDANEGVIPSVKRHDPILSINMRRILELPIYTHHERIYRYHFLRAVHSSERVWLIYTKTPEMPRSRFVEELMWEIEKKLKKRVEEEGIELPVEIYLPLKEWGMKKSEDTMKILREMDFTPSRIDTYLFCPMKFYLSHVLSLSPVEEGGEEVEPLDVGNVVHTALYRIFEPYIEREVSADDLEKIKCLLEDTVKNASKEHFRVITPEREMVEGLIITALKRYLEEELKRGTIKIHSLEGAHSMEIETRMGKVKLTGRWDRIDEVLINGTEVLRVVDYKTGSVEKYKFPRPSPLSTERSRKGIKNLKINSLQLPCYVLLLKHLLNPSLPVDAVVISIREVFKKKDEWMVSLRKNFDSDREIDEFFRPLITGIIEEILSPDVDFYMDTANCKRCSYLTPCLSLRSGGIP